MITEYQIENFKAFGNPQTLPIRPITLIFGPNSSGKISIFQSLLLLKQSLEDAEGPETQLLFEGKIVDLGNYREVVHRHDLKKDITIKFNMRKPKELLTAFKFDLFDAALYNFSALDILDDLIYMGLGISFSFNSSF